MRSHATSASRSSLVIFGYQATAIGGFSARPSCEMPRVMARLASGMADRTVSLAAGAHGFNCEVRIYNVGTTNYIMSSSEINMTWRLCLVPFDAKMT